MNRFKKLGSVLCFVLITSVATAQKAVKKYIKKYESLAVELAEKHQIPASIILGVSIIESGAGQSLICKNLNNYFGIKGKNWSSKEKMGYQSAYKEYKEAEESFVHFCKIIMNKNFYSKLKGSDNYREWLSQMNLASYASAKQKWIDDITKTIKKYELFKLDGDEKNIQASTAVAN